MAFLGKPKARNTAVVQLNIGGHRYTTSRPTLTKYPDTKLAAIFLPESTTIRAEDGTFFFDRDGTHFKFILNYLRTGKLTLPEGATALRQLEEEVEFYQIKRMLDELEFNSEILTNKEHRSLLLRWLPPQNTEKRQRCLRLLFRASQDGFRAKTFHSKCDNKGPTLTIVQSGDCVFGGFAEASWSCQGGYATCTEAFLFSMVNPHGLEPTKMPLKQDDHQKAICCRSDFGPTFGEGSYGHDLHISGNANISASSSVCLGDTYDTCNIYNGYDFHDSYNTTVRDDCFFTGKTLFNVTNYEVLQLFN